MTPQNPIISEENTSTPSAAVNPDTVVALDTINGQIVIKLYAKETPNTVATFMKKVNEAFYDGLTFHRVIPGFMAQGGDPTGTGTGGGSQKSELNQIPFKRGSLGLARTPQSKEISSDSQFFICFTDDGCQHLTGDYVNFGEVISGLEVLDKIVQGDKILKISSTTK
jgi:cyclophilin family peptidyl-prolyl cis-trans isomerase